jgi:hypothetical protein
MTAAKLFVELLVLAAKLLVALPIVAFGVAVCTNIYFDIRLKYVIRLGSPYIEKTAESQEEHDS